MHRLIPAFGLLLLGTVSAHATDLLAPADDMAPAASGPGIYIQVLGGGALGIDADYYNSTLDTTYADSMEFGWAAAGSVGVVVMDGLSLEADVFHTDRQYTDYEGGITTTSLMANAKYTVPVADSVSVYGAAGLGFILANDTFDGDDTDFSGFGYQLIGGLSVAVADHVSLVGEVRFQDSFSPLTTDLYDDTFDVPSAAALIGIKIGM
jgi:opacity protein-like surface antigen